MNGTKNLLIGLVTVAAMPAFADTGAPSVSAGGSRLEALFRADLQYKSESESDAVVIAEGHEGVYIGSGDGTVTGGQDSRNPPVVAVVRKLCLSGRAERAIGA
jgi:hypothetical protein